MIEDGNSPWLDVPGVDEVYLPLKWDVDADMLIVGWGIAWCLSAYHILESTKNSVVLIEWDRIAHGASWHNAWQIDVFFETPVVELIQKHDFEKVKEAYEAMFLWWRMLDDLIEKIQRQGDYTKYIWYNIVASRDQLTYVLEQLLCFEKMGIEINELLVAEQLVDQVWLAYKHLVTPISIQRGQEILDVEWVDWIWFEATHYATINSAMLCHSIIQYLTNRYADRFQVYEKTKLIKVETYETWVSSETTWGVISSDKILFCTNWYTEYLVNWQYQSVISPERAYMAWYHVQDAKWPLTIGYWPKGNEMEDYFYHSVRIHHDKSHEQTNLVCAWWPNLREGSLDHYKRSVTEYVKKYYGWEHPTKYFWWWTMGYTKTWFRIIWNSINAPRLFYNIWCNGVWILWSVYGAWKIVALLQWQKFDKSVFDFDQ